jgi:hypothetical protein
MSKSIQNTFSRIKGFIYYRNESNKNNLPSIERDSELDSLI